MKNETGILNGRKKERELGFKKMNNFVLHTLCTMGFTLFAPRALHPNLKNSRLIKFNQKKFIQSSLTTNKRISEAYL